MIRRGNLCGFGPTGKKKSYISEFWNVFFFDVPSLTAQMKTAFETLRNFFK